MADQNPTTAPPPVPTPFFLQPAFWVAIATPVLSILSAKLGLHLDPTQMVAVILPVVALVFGLLHHDATVTSAQVDAHAQQTAATTAASASVNAATAAAGLK